MIARPRWVGFCVVVFMLAPMRISAGSVADTKLSRPNIIFILADDYGISGVGCYGVNHKTPHLDALAKGVTPVRAVRKDLIDFSDLFPTFAELAGAKLPDGVKIDSHGFAAAIKGEKGQPRDWGNVQLGEKRSVRDAGRKLNNDGEFFDMRNAPFEQIAVTKLSDEAKSARDKLQAVLDELIAEDKAAAAPAKKKMKNKA